MRLADVGLEGWILLAAAPVIGSFLGVVVRRLPEGRPIVWSRSQCEACGTVLAPRDLVPLISWLFARGRCRRCGHPLGWFYPGIEMAALLIAVVALCVDGTPRAWLDSLFGWWLLALGWIDLRRWVLPDALTLPLIAAGLLAAVLFDSGGLFDAGGRFASGGLSDPGGLLDRMLGAAFGYLVLRAIAAAYRAVRGIEGLGRGDAKLLSAAGAWVGVGALPQVILAAALLALVAVGALRLAGVRLHAQSALPFGPFIAFSVWAVWLYGPLSL
jgi:leader peptidase (prepilin peptidase)/N-methyltransferase